MRTMIVCAICDEEASRRASGAYRTPHQHKWGPRAHDFATLKVDAYTVENGRRYKRGYAPSDLMHPISATCGRCGGSAVLYPLGLVCQDGCSLPGTEDAYRRELDRERVRIGAMPEAEL